DEGMKATVVKDRIDSDGYAEVKFETGMFNGFVGAVVDGANAVGEAAKETGEAIVNGVGEAGNAVSNFIGGIHFLKEASNETADLDLHAYFTKPGDATVYHIGMNYDTGVYETQPGTYSSGDLPTHEWIFVPKEYSVTYKVVNRKVWLYMQEHPELTEKTDGTEKYNVYFVEHKDNATLVTDPVTDSITLAEGEKNYVQPATSEMKDYSNIVIPEKETATRMVIMKETGNTFVVLSDSKLATADDAAAIARDRMTETGNYIVLMQRAGQDAKIAAVDSSTIVDEQSLDTFMKQVRSSSLNTLDRLDMEVKPSEGPVLLPMFNPENPQPSSNPISDFFGGISDAISAFFRSLASTGAAIFGWK
ncbi:MAG: hypothetical protein V1887_03005, partial [Candidatus Aenigmatarchaeota archaeon]